MTHARTCLSGVCAAALLAAGIAVASAQMPPVIAPASPTPVPGPMPEVLQKYAPVTAERLRGRLENRL
jgi:hypothetical protein